MMRLWPKLAAYLLLFAFACACTEARPQGEDKQDVVEAIEGDGGIEDTRGSYYDLAGQSSYYPNVPMDRLQMLFAQYRPTAFLRQPAYNSMNELYRMPETKRQVRYRQCYFNPISCFRK